MGIKRRATGIYKKDRVRIRRRAKRLGHRNLKNWENGDLSNYISI